MLRKYEGEVHHEYHFSTSGKNKRYLISLYTYVTPKDVNWIYLLIQDMANRLLFEFYMPGFLNTFHVYVSRKF